MKYLLLLLLLVSCAPKVEKVYTSPEIGMSYMDFLDLCGNGVYDRSSTITNNSGDTTTYELSEKTEHVLSDGTVLKGVRPLNGNSNSNRSARRCVGKFTFINNKLDTITR